MKTKEMNFPSFSIPYVDFDEATKMFVGFEKLFGDMAQAVRNLKYLPSFPYYNIRVEGDKKYVIELGVAGFGKNDLTVELEGNKLKVSGTVKAETGDEKFQYKGLSERNFSREFQLADTVVVENAQLINGVLKIALKEIAKLPTVQKIQILDKAAK